MTSFFLHCAHHQDVRLVHIVWGMIKFRIGWCLVGCVLSHSINNLSYEELQSYTITFGGPFFSISQHFTNVRVGCITSFEGRTFVGQCAQHLEGPTNKSIKGVWGGVMKINQTYRNIPFHFLNKIRGVDPSSLQTWLEGILYPFDILHHWLSVQDTGWWFKSACSIF